MTSWYEFNEKQQPPGDVLEFKPKEEPCCVEHVDASTIVERVPMTPEIQEAFEAAGYTLKEK